MNKSKLKQYNSRYYCAPHAMSNDSISKKQILIISCSEQQCCLRPTPKEHYMWGVHRQCRRVPPLPRTSMETVELSNTSTDIACSPIQSIQSACMVNACMYIHLNRTIGGCNICLTQGCATRGFLWLLGSFSMTFITLNIQFYNLTICIKIEDEGYW